MKIVFYRKDFGYDCVDADMYDGAPDTMGEAACIGTGKTHHEAFEDFAEGWLACVQQRLTQE